jgi:hypothetical protein
MGEEFDAILPSSILKIRIEYVLNSTDFDLYYKVFYISN